MIEPKMYTFLIMMKCKNVISYKIFKKNQISFTLYPEHSRVGRGNLALRHSLCHFLPLLLNIAY